MARIALFAGSIVIAMLAVGSTPSIAAPDGGDTCATATPVPGLPFSDAGSTVGATDDYDEICPYITPGSGDVVYQYAPLVDQSVNISLCAGSDYDTKLYVYENVCGPYQGMTQIACNDDACSTPSFPDEWVSSLHNVPMTAGNTYFIVVDGYDFAEGNYTIDIAEYVGPDCPPGGIDEGEADCGIPTDTTNGGCNSTPPVFADIQCGDTYCGTNGGASGMRDTDWHRLVLSGSTEVIWTGAADHDFLVGVVDNGGVDDCAGVSELLVFAHGPAGQEITASARASPPGTWWLFAAPSYFGDLACPSNYVVTVTCQPCCPADMDGSAEVDFQDLLALLAAWGPCENCPADIDLDGVVGFSDLLLMLAAWGPCPPLSAS